MGWQHDGPFVRDCGYFLPLRMLDYGLLSAFAWKKKHILCCVGGLANNSRSPGTWVFFGVLLSGAAPYKVGEHNQSSVSKGPLGLSVREGSLNTGHRQEGEIVPKAWCSQNSFSMAVFHFCSHFPSLTCCSLLPLFLFFVYVAKETFNIGWHTAVQKQEQIPMVNSS